jgi:hypothetical protein
VQSCPGLRLRRNRYARPSRRIDTAPRHENGEGYPRLRSDFGAQCPGFAAGCLRFVGWVTPPLHARLASGCWPALPGGIGFPQGSDERFQVSSTSFLLPQASPGASRVGAGVAPRPSHRSGLAAFPHPARPINRSPASVNRVDHTWRWQRQSLQQFHHAGPPNAASPASPGKPLLPDLYHDPTRTV